MDPKITLTQHGAALLAVLWAASTGAQVPAGPLQIKSVAEVEVKSPTGSVTLRPADRVVPGDRVIYTLEVRNTGGGQVDAPSVTYVIPDHVQYVVGSAAGPGAIVSYSVDGGRSFDRPENLKVAQPDGRLRPAAAADYNVIRWQLKNPLRARSVAFMRFRALVK